MPLLESMQVPLGTPMPAFDLERVDGGRLASSDLPRGNIVVILFICNHCPYVQAVENRIILLEREFGPRGVSFVGICPNDATAYPDDAPAKLHERWKSKGYGFPYLVDGTQDVARAFQAVCTPDIFVYDPERRLAYRGRIDDNWKSEAEVKNRDLARALETMLVGKAPATDQKPSMGCSIKWRA